MIFVVAGAVLAAMQASPASPAPTPASPSGATSFPAAFFASARPNTAFDMLARLPGFTFDAGDSVRGFGGAAGNVLVDGQRPSTKADSLEDLLRRIPATSVARIDLIRGSAPGIDMQGRTVLANVVLKPGARTEVIAAGTFNAYSDGRVAPTVQLDAARRRGERVLAGSVRYYNEEGGEQGTGFDRVADRAGRLVSNAQASKTDIDKGLELRGSLQTPLFGGLAHLNAAFDRTGTDQAERYFYRLPGDRPPEATLDRYRRTGGELGGDYSHSLGSKTELKVIVLQSLRNRTYNSTSDQDQTFSDFSQARRSGESILRLSATHTRSADLSFEAGAEGVFNFLKGRSSLMLDGAPVALPNARVRVEERRAEGFATMNWRISGKWSLDASMRAETSTITQSGDTEESASFFFPKPRAVVTWAPNGSLQVRARVEREVSQLDFADFVATANLATGVVSAGNANLEPERRWVTEAAFEQRFWGNGDVVLTLRHVALQKVIDQIPVEGFNAPGNIGSGRRDVALLDLTLPLKRLGMSGGLLKANAQWLSSRVTDPTTGRPRMISDDEPFSGSVTLTNDMPRLKSTWTVSLTGGVRETSYLIDEIETIRRDASLDLGWEYKPTPSLAILAQLTNVTRRARERFRQIYGGLRSDAPLAFTDRFRVSVPAAFLLRVRKTL